MLIMQQWPCYVESMDFLIYTKHKLSEQCNTRSTCWGFTIFLLLATKIQLFIQKVADDDYISDLMSQVYIMLYLRLYRVATSY